MDREGFGRFAAILYVLSWKRKQLFPHELEYVFPEFRNFTFVRTLGYIVDGARVTLSGREHSAFDILVDAVLLYNLVIFGIEVRPPGPKAPRTSLEYVATSP